MLVHVAACSPSTTSAASTRPLVSPTSPTIVEPTLETPPTGHEWLLGRWVECVPFDPEWPEQGGVTAEQVWSRGVDGRLEGYQRTLGPEPSDERIHFVIEVQAGRVAFVMASGQVLTLSYLAEDLVGESFFAGNQSEGLSGVSISWPVGANAASFYIRFTAGRLHSFVTYHRQCPEELLYPRDREPEPDV